MFLKRGAKHFARNFRVSSVKKNKQKPLLIGFLKIKMPKQKIETNTEKLKKYQSRAGIHTAGYFCLGKDVSSRWLKVHLCKKSTHGERGLKTLRITRPWWGENEGWVVFFTPVSTGPEDSQGSNAQAGNNSTQAALQSPTSAERSFPRFPWKA